MSKVCVLGVSTTALFFSHQFTRVWCNSENTEIVRHTRAMLSSLYRNHITRICTHMLRYPGIYHTMHQEGKEGCDKEDYVHLPSRLFLGVDTHRFSCTLSVCSLSLLAASNPLPTPFCSCFVLYSFISFISLGWRSQQFCRVVWSPCYNTSSDSWSSSECSQIFFFFSLL